MRPESALASSAVPDLILPARLSVTLMDLSTVAKLHLKATSPFRTSSPAPAASIGPLPEYALYGS